MIENFKTEQYLDYSRVDVIVTTPYTLRKIICEAVVEAFNQMVPKPEPPKQSGGMLTLTEACRVLRCSKPTLRKMVREGKVEATRVGKQYRFGEEYIKAFYASPSKSDRKP